MDDRRVRIAISSDRRLFRDSLAASLEFEPGLEVVGHVAESALPALCEVGRPDVLLFDVGLDAGASLGTLERFQDRCPEVRTVVMYDRLSVRDLARAWRAGANALVPVTGALDTLLLLVHRLADRAGTVAEDSLSDQEREIIALMTAGHTTTGTADLLHLTPAAVEHAKRRIYHKLGVACQSEAVARVVALGLLDHSRSPAAHPAAAGEPLVVLRGSDPAARLAALTALLHANLAVQQELVPRRGGEPWDRAQRGPVVLILLEPDARDWLSTEGYVATIVLVHAAAPPPARLADMLLHGVSAVLAADRVPDDLLPVLSVATRGYVALDTGDAHTLLVRQRGPDTGAGLPDLTPREAEILCSIACGHTVRQTARALGIATKTVENTQARLFRKLGAHNRAGALSIAHSLGLIEPLEPPRGPAARRGALARRGG
jgi:two-component system nitrate/nitrite response regulator NarL